VKCVICRHGEIKPGSVTVTLERGTAILVVKGVPARVCRTCGEEYVDEATTQHLLDAVAAAEGAGVQVGVRQFAAA
jgi:YgiT-type zinc finger domain-containing protein